jgi:DNA-binding NarL/FixJ family response regulator
LNVLIVEDNSAFRRSFRAMLAARFPGMQIHEAWEPTQALSMVEGFMPELVFMDIQLPGQSGLDLAKKIKGIWPLTSIVILTSHDLPEYREAALCVGASCFLCKGEMGPQEIERVVLSLFPSVKPGCRA